MNRLVVAIAILMISSPVSVVYANATTSNQEVCPDTQMTKLAREAHTGEQYSVLADCYAARQRMFRRKASEEMHLWAVRNAMINPLSEKWPRPVDSARNLHDYYEYKASQAARMQAMFSKRADEADAK
jgi:hypothetical protein